MASEIGKKDENSVTVAMGVTDDASKEIRMLRVDPSTNRLLVTATGTTVLPAGLNTYVQFNDAGAMGGDAGFTYNKTTDQLTLGENGQSGSIKFYSEQGATDYALVIQPSSSMTQNVTLTMPVDDGTNGQALVTNGSGVLSWTTVAGVPGAPDTSIQFNDGGSFGGDSDLLWNKTTNTLTIGNTNDSVITTAGDGINLEIDTSDGVSAGFSGGALALRTGSATAGDADGGGMSSVTGNGHGTGVGGPLTLATGVGGATGNGGLFTLTTGNGGATSGIGGTFRVTTGNGVSGNSGGGDIFITNGNGSGSAGGGEMTLTSGDGGATGNGGFLKLISGTGGATSGNGGLLNLISGSAASGNSAGGDIVLNTGQGSGTGAGGSVTVTAATGGTTGNGGGFFLTTGNSGGGNNNGGTIDIISGDGSGSGQGGIISFTAGFGGATGIGGPFEVLAGDGGATSGKGGVVTIVAGKARGGNSDGGDITLASGIAHGTGNAGNISILPGNGGGTDSVGGNVIINTGSGTGASPGGSVYIGDGVGGGIGAGGSSNARGGDVFIQPGDGGLTNGDGGDTEILGGRASGSGKNGDVYIRSGQGIGGGHTAGTVYVESKITGGTALAAFDTSTLSGTKTFTFPNQTGILAATPDPGANTIYVWDDTDNLPKNATIGTGLSYDHASHTLSSTAVPGGSDTYVQFNDGGSTFGGDAGFTYNKTTDTVTVGKVVVGSGAADGTVQSNGNFDLILQTGNGTTGTVTIADGANGNITLAPNGTGKVYAKNSASAVGALLDTSSLTSSDKTFTFPDQSGIFATVTSGAGAPGSTPAALGQIYINTGSSTVYVSTGTSSSSDWKAVN